MYHFEWWTGRNALWRLISQKGYKIGPWNYVNIWKYIEQNMLTRSSYRIFNPTRYTGNSYIRSSSGHFWFFFYVIYFFFSRKIENNSWYDSDDLNPLRRTSEQWTFCFHIFLFKSIFIRCYRLTSTWGTG